MLRSLKALAGRELAAEALRGPRAAEVVGLARARAATKSGIGRWDRMRGRRSEPDERLDRVSGGVIGAAIEVHRALGPGLLESTYENAFCVELGLREIAFARQAALGVFYKGRAVGELRLDLLVERCLVVELKAVDTVAPVHTAQLLAYLRVTRVTLGLLINFNVPRLRDGIKRVINTA